MNLEMVKQLQAELPQSIQDMVAVIGFSHTLKVVQALGGTTWRIASGRGKDGEAKRAALAERVGTDTEELLHKYYAGDEIYLPRCAALLRKLRNIDMHQQFERDVRQGRTARDSVADLAREHKLSDRQIWDILNLYMPVPKQQGLF